MEIGGHFDGLLPSEKLPSSDSFWISTPSNSLKGSSSMANFESSTADVKPLFSQFDNGNTVNEYNEQDQDRSLNQQEKKRRLSFNQVRYLDKCFEVDNKLGPERKFELANELGLQPRQIAVWFQNRRARYKTKQLEKDYDALKACYDELKANYANLFKENENLKNEVDSLKEKLRGKEKLEPCDLPIELNEKPILITNSQIEEDMKVMILGCKQDDVNSAKSDVFDTESIESCPFNTNARNSMLMDLTLSSQAFELDQSGDFSQDEEDNFSKSLMTPPLFPKLEEDGCYDYPVEDQTLWFWP